MRAAYLGCLLALAAAAPAAGAAADGTRAKIPGGRFATG
jgi:hypothetical protein